MAMRRRPAIVVSLAVGVVAVVVAGLVTAPMGPMTAGIQASGGSLTIIHGDLPPPLPGHEVYGFVPYWEMDAGIADHLAGTDLSTLALFSVTHGRGGHLATKAVGYRRIDGPVGWRMISEARAGTESGRTIRKKTVSVPAPSISADSKSSLGSALKKFARR